MSQIYSTWETSRGVAYKVLGSWSQILLCIIFGSWNFWEFVESTESAEHMSILEKP